MDDPSPEPPPLPPNAERSKSGTPIYRYNLPTEKPEIVTGDPSLIKAIDRHIEKHLGEPAWVFHEIVSTTIHVDIHVCPPTAERPFYTLVTSGMAERPMKAPPQASECEFAELCVCLPPDWPGLAETKLYVIPGDDSDHPWNDERHYWPVRMLKWLARFPHEYRTWIWHGHTAHNGNPATPFAPNTQMCAAMLDVNPQLPEDFHHLRVGDRDVAFFTVYPLHEDEVRYKLDHGYKAFTDKLEAAGITAVIDPARRSVVAPPPKSKPWWKFWPR